MLRFRPTDEMFTIPGERSVILDSLKKADFLQTLHKGIGRAVCFLNRADFRNFQDGRQDIPDFGGYLIISTDQGRGREASPLEFHRRYIDIQLILEGVDCMGWKPVADCQLLKHHYEHERDIGFYADLPDTWFEVGPGNLAVFFPTDAHAPLAGSGRLRKAIAKVPVEAI